MAIPIGITFLIVDDFPSVRSMLKASIKSLGFNGVIFEADDVISAREVFDKNSIDFIVCDIKMPGEEGTVFLSYVRAQVRGKNIPFIFLTTVSERPEVINAIKRGASNYLIKPWKPELLKEKIVVSWEKHHPKK